MSAFKSKKYTNKSDTNKGSIFFVSILIPLDNLIDP